MNATKTAQVIEKPQRPAVLSRTERLAYHAAHRILTEDWSNRELACRGAQRSHQLDALARIIAEVFQS